MRSDSEFLGQRLEGVLDLVDRYAPRGKLCLSPRSRFSHKTDPLRGLSSPLSIKRVVDALEAGLVDALGGFRRAVALAAESAGADPDAAVTLKRFPEAREPFRALLEDTFGAGLESSGAGGLTGLLRRLERLAGILGPLLDAAERLENGPTPGSLRAPELRPAG